VVIAKKTLTAAFRLLDVIGYQYRRQIRKTFGDLEAWRIGVLTGCFASGFVLHINLILLLVAAFRYEGFQDGIATLTRGKQDTIARMSTAYHILINVISTILLSCSSYTMQVLSSPTRSEVDAAHDKGQWLTIGLLSTRNLRHISRKRLILWLVLAASSIPLHLLWVYVTTDTSQELMLTRTATTLLFSNIQSLTTTRQDSSTIYPRTG